MLRHFFHIHTYNNDNEKFEVGQVISTTKYNREGRFWIIPNDLEKMNLKKSEKNHLMIFLQDFHAFFYQMIFKRLDIGQKNSVIELVIFNVWKLNYYQGNMFV